MPSPRGLRHHRPGAPPVIVLAFDCAVTGLGVAVVDDGRCRARLFEEGRDQAARLVPAIAEALDRAGVARREVGLLAVTVGPGSFTGVRVGLAAARGLAVGLGVPLAGIATTDVLLAQARPSPGEVAVAAIDSRLGDWFCALSAGSTGQSPFVAGPGDLAGRLAGRPAHVVGIGATALAAALQPVGIAATAAEQPPDPVMLAELAVRAGRAHWLDANRSHGLPRPLYLRGVNITLPDGARRTVDLE